MFLQNGESDGSSTDTNDVVTDGANDNIARRRCEIISGSNQTSSQNNSTRRCNRQRHVSELSIIGGSHGIDGRRIERVGIRVYAILGRNCGLMVVRIDLGKVRSRQSGKTGSILVQKRSCSNRRCTNVRSTLTC